MAANEQITVSDTATGLDLEKVNQFPRAAVLVNVENHPVRAWFDGSDPTASEGILLEEGTVIVINDRAQARDLRVIRATGDDAQLNVQYLDTISPSVIVGDEDDEDQVDCNNPDEGDVREGETYAPGDSMTGTLVVPATSDVREGTDVDDTTGTLKVPSAGDVRHGEDVDDTQGTLAVPDKSDVRHGTDVDDTTGTAHIPAAADVRHGTDVDDTTGTLDLPDEEDVKDGVSYDNETKTGTLEPDYPDKSDVIKGVEFDDDQKTGTYVNPVTTLPGSWETASCGLGYEGELHGLAIFLGDCPQEQIQMPGWTIGNDLIDYSAKDLDQVMLGCEGLDLNDNKLIAGAVDDFLEGLAANDIDDGYCNLFGGTNTPPTSVGEAAITTLEGRDWDVYVNE